jgi:hypothetical protein
MLSILKSDATWFPESSDGSLFKLRANKDILLKSRDFELYDTGLNLDFLSTENIVFDVLDCYRNVIQLKNNVMKQNNYLEAKSKIVTMINVSNDDIYIKETEFVLTFRLEPKENKQHGLISETEFDVKPVSEPTITELPVEIASVELTADIANLEVSVETTIIEPTIVTPVNLEVSEEPTTGPLAEPEVIVSVDVPKKRKYIKKK